MKRGGGRPKLQEDHQRDEQSKPSEWQRDQHRTEGSQHILEDYRTYHRKRPSYPALALCLMAAALSALMLILSDGYDEKGKLRTRARYFDIVPKMQHCPRYRLQHHGARGGQDVGPHI